MDPKVPPTGGSVPHYLIHGSLSRIHSSRIELNSTELQLLQPCSQSTSWRWRAWPITRRVTGSTWCWSAQFSLFRLLWTPHWKAWARLKEIGTRWNQRCLIFQCVPIYLKGRSFTSVFIFSWGTPLKRQSVWLHTHTPDRLLYKTVGSDARISQKLHMQPSPNIPCMLPLAPAQPALAALR